MLDVWLMTPVLRDPPLYTLADVRSWVTIRDVQEAHDLMNLESMAAEKQRLRSEGRNNFGG